jgi:CRISPR-associated endonuclease/helicase Cas3
MPLLNLWAKTEPFHPLLCHMLDVGHTAQALIQTGPFRGLVSRWALAVGLSPEHVPAWLAYLTAMHDHGKARAEFQAKGTQDLLDALSLLGIPEPALLSNTEQARSYRHEAGSAEWLTDYLTDKLRWDTDVVVALATAIRGHHGDFGAESPEPEVPKQRERWEPLREQLHAAVYQAFAPAPWSPQSLPDPSTAGLLLAGLTVLADWIASNGDIYHYTYEQESLLDYIPKSRQRALSATAQLGLDANPPWPSPASFGLIFPNIKSGRPLQTKLEQLVRQSLPPGLAIIEAPMGEGKSEAAMYLATQWQAGGIYLALPTMATSNQMYHRYREFLSRHDPVSAQGARLVHGMAWLFDEATPDEPPNMPDDDEATQDLALDWFRPAKRSLLAAHGVGTVDQVLKGALHVRHGFLRLFALIGKVLVIDEIHAYDAYMTRILVRLLRWCGHLQVPVILLSATLPQRRREELLKAYSPDAKLQPPLRGTSPYPLLTFATTELDVREEPVDASDRHVTIRVHQHYGFLADEVMTAELALKLAQGDRCICVIANSVVRAQRIYRELLRSSADLMDLLLFHARFPVDERQEREVAALRRFDKRSLLEEGNSNRTQRPKRAILVATQVVEQSLDLDFDAMISDLAPIDLLLQRAGRLHRHNRGPRPAPELHICHPEVGTTDYGGKVYHRHLQWLTQQALMGIDTWELPSQIRTLVENVYQTDDSPFCQEWVADQRSYQQKADTCLIPPPRKDTFSLGDLRLGTLEDDETSNQAYIVARTRPGDDTVQVLLVDGEDWAPLLTRNRPPSKEILQRIYLRTVNLPKWWLPRGGELGPRWLPGIRVLRLTQRRWEGITEKGERYAIKAHPVYGVIRLEGDEAW